jgi:Tfp pilus assembly protein PilN
VATQLIGSPTTTATMPRVNLLPPEIAQRAKARKAQVAMVATGLAAVAVVGVMYTNAQAKVASANEEKSSAAAANVKLRADLAGLQNVQDVRTQVDQANATLISAMANEVTWSRYLHDLTLTIPENVWLTSFTATVNGPTAAGGTGTVLDPGLGTVTVTGKAFTHDDVAAWLESLAKEKGYVNPYFTSSEEELIGTRKVVTHTSTVNLSPAALSGRYAKGLEGLNR